MQELQEKVEQIAKKYADLAERRIDEIMKQEAIEREEMYEVYEGIRMMNHVVSAFQKLNTCNKEGEKETLQSIDSTLKRIEEILLNQTKPKSISVKFPERNANDLVIEHT